MEQLRRGDRSAFALVIERNQRSVYGYLRARLQQASDADDMMQEVFLRFYVSQARFDSTALIRPWLLGIARNLLREHVRDVKRRKEVAWTELCLDCSGTGWGPCTPSAHLHAVASAPIQAQRPCWATQEACRPA